MHPDADSAAGQSVSQTLALFELGGPVVYILFAMSVIALAIVLIKWYQFFVLKIRDRRFVPLVLQHYSAGRGEEALRVLERRRGPVAEVMEVAIGGQVRRDVKEQVVREEVDRVATNTIERMRSYLRGLEVIATLSPLLGLFGTVLGMIDAFQQLEQAGNRVNPSILSGGIWEALLTTAAGLAVAIPSLVALNWFERAVQRTAHDMEDAATRVFTISFHQPPWTHGASALQPDRAENFD